MTYKHNDGGSARSPNSGYCAVRALAIANEMEWSNAERHIRKFAKVGKGGNGTISKGVYKEDFDSALNVLGWYWVKAPIIIGRKARAKDLPSGTYIARQANHFVAVVNGICNDTFNSSDKMVYGYWAKK